MRILILSSLFPPDALGGAEISAWNLACWLRDHGHDVGVLTTAGCEAKVADDVLEDGLRVWRILMPRPYPMMRYGDQSAVAKFAWHIQDHADPRNVQSLRRVLDVFKPDFASVHLLTGLGWNGLAELGRRDIAVLCALPDLALACVRSGMFRHGRICQRQCFECRLSASWKKKQLDAIPRLGFYSPSRANLERVEAFVDMGSRPRRVILNPNRYPMPATEHEASAIPRFFYAGRLHRTKGVDVLLTAAERLASRSRKFEMAIVGDGPEGATLRAAYEHQPWLTFHGHVPQQRVSDLMAQSDLLCLPSVWSENAPGVAIQALTQGLPILASNVGGIPEIVEPGLTGGLVPAGDIDAWTEALDTLIVQPQHIKRWRASAQGRRNMFDAEVLGARLFDLMLEIMQSGPHTSGRKV